MIEIGKQAPYFKALGYPEGTYALENYKGQWLILYFYPKDDTSGCTQEACSFQEALPKFDKLGVQVLGVSKDSVLSHEKFSKKYHLNFPLLTDDADKICVDYGVWMEKSMYGRKYMGIDRSTFLIDPNGVIQYIWRKVKVAKHIEEIDKILIKIKEEL